MSRAESWARVAGGLALIVLIAACSSQTGERQSLLRTVGLRQPPPDEFLVVERRPLELPPDTRALPPPDPEGINRTDPQPREEVTALLVGPEAQAPAAEVSPGQRALLERAGVPSADPGIRAALQAEDDAVQNQRGQYALRTFLGRRTFDPYGDQVLDPFEETERLREEGVATPAAPPRPEEEPGRIF